MDDCCSPARRFATGRMSGNRPAGRRSARSGDTERTSRLTGAQIIFIANRNRARIAGRSQQGFADYHSLPAESRAALQGRLTELTRRNTYDAASDTIVLDGDRAAAFEELASYYADVYGKGRDEYAIPAGALSDPAKQRQMATFFWWTAWAASTNRPGQDVTYTQNWPHEELVGNRPTGGTIVWSVISFVLLAGRNRRNGVVFRFAGTRALSGRDAAHAILCLDCSQPLLRKRR